MRLVEILTRSRLALFTPRELGLLGVEQSPRLTALQLHQWARKGWVKRLKRGLYELAYPEPPALPDFYVANRLYEPSYVSLETALSHYHLIPETAAQITSVTSLPTRRFRNSHGLFTYFTVRPQAFAGYQAVKFQGCVVRLAEPEKAVVDWLYAGLRRGEALRPDQDRWDRRRMRVLDRAKLRRYATLFTVYRRTLEDRLHALHG